MKWWRNTTAHLLRRREKFEGRMRLVDVECERISIEDDATAQGYLFYKHLVKQTLLGGRHRRTETRCVRCVPANRPPAGDVA